MGLVALLGGIRGTVFAGIALLLAIALGVQTARVGAAQRAEQKAEESLATYSDLVIEATKKAKAAADRALTAYQALSAQAESSYQAGRESADQHQATVVADLRAGNVRLRQLWTGCVQAAPAGKATGPAPEGQDGASELRAEAAGRVVRVGADANNQVIWLQAELNATRALYEKCGAAE